MLTFSTEYLKYQKGLHFCTEALKYYICFNCELLIQSSIMFVVTESFSYKMAKFHTES